MKALIVSNSIWSICNYRIPLIKSIQEKGVEVIAVAPYDEWVSELEKKGIDYINIDINRKGNNVFEDFKLILRLLSIYKNEKPDYVIHYTIKPVIYGTLATILTKSKAINNITGLGYTFIGNSLHHTFLRPMVKFLYKLSLRHSYRIFFQNEDDRNYFYESSLINEKDDFTKILPGSGVDIEYFKKPGLQEKQDDTIRFLYVGRILGDKGIYELVKAAKNINKQYSNTEFLLLGGLDYDNPSYISKETIEKWEKQNIITHLGHVDDVRPYLAESDVFVLPSYREGTPRSTLEAMAMELPVITTDVPGCRRTVIENENGLFVKKGDSKSLEKTIAYMINNPHKREKMGKTSRKIVEDKFDVNLVNNYFLEAMDLL